MLYCVDLCSTHRQKKIIESAGVNVNGKKQACSRDDHDAPVRRLGQHLLRVGRDFAVAVEQGAVQIEGRKKDGVR